MPNATSVITRTLGQTIGWNRIGIAISLMIIAIAASRCSLLRDIEIEKVIVASKATSLRTVLTAGVFVAAATSR